MWCIHPPDSVALSGSGENPGIKCTPWKHSLQVRKTRVYKQSLILGFASMSIHVGSGFAVKWVMISDLQAGDYRVEDMTTSVIHRRRGEVHRS